MNIRPNPIEELKPGEFYSIQSSDRRPSVIPVLLLEQLPNNLSKLLLLNSSDSDLSYTCQATTQQVRKFSMQIETVPLEAVYQYHVFPHPPNKILQWPNDYEGEELIMQISEEMRKAMREGRWVYNFPHFCEGYLQIYLSYLRWRVDCPKREERVTRWFHFMGSYYFALRDHLLRDQLLSEECISSFMQNLPIIDQISERSSEISEGNPVPLHTDKQLNLAKIKKMALEAYRPSEISSWVFNGLWQHILLEYHQDMLKSPARLSLRSLLLDSPKLIWILSRRADFTKVLSDAKFPGLRLPEIVNVELQIAVIGMKEHYESSYKEPYRHAFGLVERLFEKREQFNVSEDELSRVILEKQLIDPILESRNETLEGFVMTRHELFPLVVTHIKRNTLVKFCFSSMLQCLAIGISLDNMEFISFLIEHNALANVAKPTNMNTVQTYLLIKKLIEVSIEHRLSPELVKALIPCEHYGRFVLPALMKRCIFILYG